MADASSSKPNPESLHSEAQVDKDENSTNPIPDGWIYVPRTRKNGSEFGYYLCPETKQRFSTYDELVRYVIYAAAAMVSIYSPYFRAKLRKNDLPSSIQVSQGQTDEASDQDSMDVEMSFDPEDVDTLDNMSNQEELSSMSESYALPPMDRIELLPIQCEQGDEKNIYGLGAKAWKRPSWGELRPRSISMKKINNFE